MQREPDFEDEYNDILQNIEFVIVSIYRQHQELIDSNVETALQSLIRTYRNISRGGSERPPSSPLAAKVYVSMKEMCDWRLGRESLQNFEGEIGPGPTPITVDEIISCLQRIRRSVKIWGKKGGRQGYLYFINQFIL